MIHTITTFIKRLFHKHHYVKIDFRQVTGEHTRWSERKYRCDGCGKTRWVDGRLDPYE